MYIHEKETALIPGKVLSPGKLTKKVSIAAWSFSEKAHEKIKKAGGKTLTIEELDERQSERKRHKDFGITMVTIIDSEGAVLGRFCTTVAKRLLNGEEIAVVNSEKVIVTGKKDHDQGAL